MSNPIFTTRPHVPLLQWLARGSLKQNLLRSIRLWVWLCYLYSDDNDGEPFTFVHLRDTFFSQTHPKGDEIPELHDPSCTCAKTTADWIFNATIGVSPSEWRRSLLSHDAILDTTLDETLQRRLFAVTRRSLHTDIQILTELGWLKRQEQTYYRVSQFPEHPIDKSLELDTTRVSAYTLNFLHPDLANIAQNLSQQADKIQRFNLHVDYVIPKTTLDRVDDWQDQLKTLWEQTPVPPVRLTYKSARVGQTVKCIVYPVCVYYIQRAVYLCAFGETPTKQGEWYNYRLDHIEQMIALDWKNPNLPPLLCQHYPHNLPKPDFVEEQMAKAWGFDFYLEPKLMLLRFDREFDDRYIQGTFRHETFQSVTYQQAEKLILKHTHQPQKLLKVLHSRQKDDAYYQVYYRDGDTNVGLRLRAWRPRCEVLLPWELRQNIAQEVQQEFFLYQN